MKKSLLMPITQHDIAVDMIENPDNYGAGEMVEVLVLLTTNTQMKVKHSSKMLNMTLFV